MQTPRQGRLLSFFFSSRRRHTRCSRDWSSDVCSSDLCVTTRPALGVRYRVSPFQMQVMLKMSLSQNPFTEIPNAPCFPPRSEEHTSELQSRLHLVCRLLLEKKKKKKTK